MRSLASRILFLGMVALVLMPLTCYAQETKHSSAGGRGPASQQAAARTVTVNFGNRAIGALYVCPSNYPVITKSLRMTALAKGPVTVRVPRLYDLVLVANATSIQQPLLFDSIPPDALDVLVINAVSLDEEEDKLSDNLLSRVSRLTSLKELFIAQIGVSDAGLCKVKACKKLVYLCVGHSNLNGSCFKDLAGLTRLSHLDVSGNAIKPENYQSLARLPQLRTLRVDKTNLDVQGVENLAKCSALSNLNVSNNSKVTDECLKYIAQLKNLEVLDLGETSITMVGLSYLRNLKRLRKMLLSKNSFSLEQRASIQNILPHVQIGYEAHSKAVTDEVRNIYSPLKRY